MVPLCNWVLLQACRQMKLWKDSGIALDRIDEQGASRGKNDGGQGKAVVQAIVDMAHSLGLSTVAEGVETEDQLRMHCAFGCEEIQGFLLSRPLPPSQFEQFFRSQKRTSKPAPQRSAAYAESFNPSP